MKLVDESMTVKEIQKVARDMNLRGYSRLRKAELIEFVNEFIQAQIDLDNGDDAKAMELASEYYPAEVYGQTGLTVLELAKEAGTGGYSKDKFKHFIDTAELVLETYTQDWHVNSDLSPEEKNADMTEINIFIEIMELFEGRR